MDGRHNVSTHDWRIEDPSGAQHNISTNTSLYFVHQFTEVGTYNVWLTAGGYIGENGTWAEYYTHFEEILCRYVKREVRSLTVSDREEFLDAAVTMWKTSAGEGRELYGSKFTSIDEFTLHHAYQVSSHRSVNLGELVGAVACLQQPRQPKHPPHPSTDNPRLTHPPPPPARYSRRATCTATTSTRVRAS